MVQRDPESEREVPLRGGNASAGVVRVGDTVRRPAGPWTPAVHALLRHLHGVGFRGAPRPLGIDEQGREVLTFVPGRVVWPDHFGELDERRRLQRVAVLVRAFHDAVATFTAPEPARWQRLIPAEGDEIIAHHDLAPWNLVMTEGGWVFIDWDAAAPGSRLWDLAYALHGFVPLSASPALQRPDQESRLRLFVDAYGLDEAERRRLVPMLARRSQAMADFLREQAAIGRQPWRRLREQGHETAWRSDTAYAAAHADRWLDALLR